MESLADALRTGTDRHRGRIKLLVATLLLIIAGNPVSGQTESSDRWSVITRWDYRVRIDGRYIGHADRELRESYRTSGMEGNGLLIEGEARLLGATRKNGLPVAARLEAAETVSYMVEPDGSVSGETGVFPSLRGFPSIPPGALEPGDTWEAPLESVVFGPDGRRGSLLSLASYHYAADRPFQGRDAVYLDVQWALRYRGEEGSLSDFVQRADGNHRMSLVMDRKTMRPIMARDSLKETWMWTDSRVEEREGFALVFWRGVVPLETGEIRNGFENNFSDNSEDIIIAETPRGLSVVMRSLHFLPDLPDILPEDMPLIDLLADTLAGIPQRTIIIRGHTADVGRPDDQYRLSEERARRVAAELTARGIDPGRLVYEGVGADEPVSPNDTEDGRRFNRRVEFLILED